MKYTAALLSLAALAAAAQVQPPASNAVVAAREVAGTHEHESTTTTERHVSEGRDTNVLEARKGGSGGGRGGGGSRGRVRNNGIHPISGGHKSGASELWTLDVGVLVLGLVGGVGVGAGLF
jgi:hypothetical protein